MTCLDNTGTFIPLFHELHTAYVMQLNQSRGEATLARQIPMESAKLYANIDMNSVLDMIL
jgi:hypothetical protein